MAPLGELLWIALATALAGAGAYLRGDRVARALDRAWQGVESLAGPRWAPGLARAAAGGIVGVGILGYGLFLSSLAIAQHHGLGTHVADLGYYDNLLHQSSHGVFLGCSYFPSGRHTTAHFDPILILLSPLHRLYPRAEGLLVFQSFWLASGAIPVYLLARRVLGRGAVVPTPGRASRARPSQIGRSAASGRGPSSALQDPEPCGGAVSARSGRAEAVIIALAYLFYPALAGANAFDFHSLTLVVVPLLWLAWAFEAGKEGVYYGALAIALLCREDVALVTSFVGLAMVLSRRPGAVRRGAITLGASVAWFAVVKTFFMPAADASETGKLVRTFAHYYQELLPDGGGPARLVVNVLTHPLLTLGVVLREAKAVFLLQIFLPLAFLPLVAKRGRLSLIYGLALSLLASKPAVFDIYHQYPCTLFPLAFALTPYGLRGLAEERDSVPSSGRPDKARGARLYAAGLGALVTGSLLVGCVFGVFFPNGTFRAGAAPLVRTLTPEQRETYAWVEEQAARIPEDASVGTSQSLGPHVSSRMRVYFYPDRLDVDWVFIDEGETTGESLGSHHRAVRTGALVEVARRGQLVLYRRR